MEDKKLLTNEELETVSGGRAKLDENVQDAFQCAKVQLESIIGDRADDNYRNNVNLMLVYCGQALDGSISAEAALKLMHTRCNQINIDYRRAPQDILDQLRSSLGR